VRELGTLPTAGYQGYAEERISLRYNYGRIQLSGPVIRAMKSDKGSFTRAVDSESKGVVRDLKQDVERQLFGTSDGVIATCTTTTGSTTVVNLATTTTAVQMRQFRINMRVDIGTVAQLGAGSGGRVHGAVISAVDAANKTITIDYLGHHGQHRLRGSCRVLAALPRFRRSLRVFRASWPLRARCSTLTRPPALTGRRTSTPTRGTNRTPTETLFVKALQQTEIAGGEAPNLFVTSDGVHRGYACGSDPVAEAVRQHG
jgi:hypothetical protein